MAVKPIVLFYDTNTNPPGLDRLRASLTKWGWEYEFLHDTGGWRGFGRRLKFVESRVRELATEGRYSHAINIDARDVIATGPATEFTAPEVPLLLSTERGVWPDWDLMDRYPLCAHPWRFVNSQFVIDVTHTDLLHTKFLTDEADDQRHLTKLFLDGTAGVALDYDCKYVASIAFCDPKFEDWFAYDGDRLVHKITGSKPLLAHGNGGVDMSWVRL